MPPGRGESTSRGADTGAETEQQRTKLWMPHVPGRTLKEFEPAVAIVEEVRHSGEQDRSRRHQADGLVRGPRLGKQVILPSRG
jgi:hypothetical protein